jgi:MFS transporter, SHS family, sialic acid transporter
MGSPNSAPISRGQWLALTAALLGWMFDGFEMGIFPLVGRPALVDVLGLSEQAYLTSKTTDSEIKIDGEQGASAAGIKMVDAQVGRWMGRITAAFLVGAALGGWIFGWLGDRIGRVRAMVFSVLTYAAFTGLCGLAESAWQLAGLRFLSALGMGGEWSLGVALVMESWAPQSRPVLAGLIGAIGNVGYVLTTLPVIVIAGLGMEMHAGGWRWVFGLCAFPALLTFFFRMFVPESERWRHAVASGPRARFAEIFTSSLRRKTIVGAILGGIALIGTWGSVQWAPTWVIKETGSQQMANYVQMASGIGAIIGTFLGAVIGYRADRRWTYFTLCLGSLLICGYVFRFHAWFDWRFVAVMIVVGAFTASFYGWLPLYLPELFPTRLRATGQGFAFNFGRIIAAGGALGMGLLMSEGASAGSYAKAGAIITLIYLAGMIVVWLAPETRGQPLPE